MIQHAVPANRRMCQATARWESDAQRSARKDRRLRLHIFIDDSNIALQGLVWGRVIPVLRYAKAVHVDARQVERETGYIDFSER